ncbi:glycerophosphodiester phosphodiesterase GDPDL3-like isoform X1 [Actinidia eriantha]|uniref:glycerophosphodiester phosphodiesterase GDPDL3-like isoform X1 n=1 Tax=Actinidia eriantha TaxID=165200 RepID=UPI00258C6E48|nr:glycerophosphodiester phosphodiesterase GDPDL3-like isoform X1 [Actinidia eriantha]
MCKLRSIVCLVFLCLAALAAAQGSKNQTKPSPWQTLAGNEPLIIARGGFSGLFADSSSAAYQLASLTSLRNVIFWCDVQLTKDGAGICFPSLTLDNSSDIALVFKTKDATYSVNGVSMHGWFSVDFTLNDLGNIYLTQGIYSRPNLLDGNMFQILTVQDVAKQLNPPGLWLNVQHDAFFSQKNLSMRGFVLSVLRSTIVDYISSPEVNFLRGIYARKPNRTKLIFRFLGKNEVEPSFNQTYDSLLSNLTFIKTFASGILVPKSYIWPVDSDGYLLAHTSVVLDAHREGLEVFASGFANDDAFAYNYSYNPVAEYLSFVDNGEFSVDGVLSDFPVTPSAAIACFSHIGKNMSGQEKPLVISHKGSSGDYPDCTDLAYQRAISDGVDVLDCPVQMTKDGIPVCLGSINLGEFTLAAQSQFSNQAISIPELGVENGIFTFNLTWSEIQGLQPAISNPFASSRLYRNPNNKNAGKFMTLSEFLDLANNAISVSGVLIIIEDAAYLAEKEGLSVTDSVLGTLKNYSGSSQLVKKIMIQSTNSSVLIKFKKESNYELVYRIEESIRDVDNLTITEIKSFAHSVVVSKDSVFPDNQAYLTGMTNVVQKLKAFNLSVYVQRFRNEFLSQAWDFFSDANVEINSFVMGAGIDGVITEFPGTAAKYKKNKCLGLGDKTPPYMSPVQPGSLMQLITPQYLPPAEAPKPVLTESDVVEPPLPTVAELGPPSGNGNGTTAPPLTPPSGQPEVVACIFLSSLAVLLSSLALI